MNTKEQIKKIIYYIGWRALGAFVFVTVAGTSLWALAAFTEPTTTPGNSVQDFVTNILGANNANNAFDSSNVTANANGSVVERLESVQSSTDNLYSACLNVYAEMVMDIPTYPSTAHRPSCPSGFNSVAGGHYVVETSTFTRRYVTWSACCLPR